MVNDHYKGKGYGTQALLILKEIAKIDYPIEVLYAGTTEENIRSRRALEKAGFRVYVVKTAAVGICDASAIPKVRNSG